MADVVAGAETGVSIGPLLRGWRERRRVSQLELALRADSSARHISFIETGRSRPSPAMVLRLAEHLDIPIRDRNALLVAAGHAPAYPETPLHDEAMAAVRGGLEQVLRAHEPHPALVLDGRYDIVAVNRGIGVLLDGVAAELLEPPMNAMRITLHPRGLAPRIRNLGPWREHLLERMERQIALRGSAPLRALFEEVTAYPAPPGHRGDDEGPDGVAGTPGTGATGAGAAGTAGAGPDATAPHPFALPLRIEAAGRVLSFLSTVTTFNTPMDVTVSELAVETFLPADPETARALAAILPTRAPA